MARYHKPECQAMVCPLLPKLWFGGEKLPAWHKGTNEPLHVSYMKFISVSNSYL